MAQAVSYDDPVDLSRGKLMNGLIKEEQRSLERHAVYGGHNGIRVGIPDQNHGMLMRLNKKNKFVSGNGSQNFRYRRIGIHFFLEKILFYAF